LRAVPKRSIWRAPKIASTSCGTALIARATSSAKSGSRCTRFTSIATTTSGGAASERSAHGLATLAGDIRSSLHAASASAMTTAEPQRTRGVMERKGDVMRSVRS
jgi:hypothetical protein